MNSHLFSLHRDHSNWLTLSNASELFWSWISINHIQVHKEKVNFVTHCLFTSFTKRYFHVVVVQWRKRNVQKAWCTCNVVVFPCQALVPFFNFSSPPHLKLRTIYDTFWSVRNRIFSAQIELPLLIASKTFFDSSVVPSFLVRKAWWTNRATVAR